MTSATTEASKVALLLDIASKSVDFIERQQTRRIMQDALNGAYANWREDNSVHHRIEQDSVEWKMMMDATASEYEDLSDAKREEANAAKRLRHAVFKYKKEIDADRARAAGLEAADDKRVEVADMYAQFLP